MRILVVNDDGIDARGIAILAELAKEIGEVCVLAPDQQCSAMSQRITVRGELELQRRHDFPVKDVEAYSLSGTPADCVKVAVEYLMKEKPDYVFSGINMGYNVGFEVAYSGTVGAAMEAVSKGIPAMAFSTDMIENYDVTKAQFVPLVKELLMHPLASNEIWNVNFPGCSLQEYKGICWNTGLAQTQYFLDHYEEQVINDDIRKLTLKGEQIRKAPEDTDIRALMDGYISVSRIRSAIYD